MCRVARMMTEFNAGSREDAIRSQHRLRGMCRWERTIENAEITLVAGADAAYGHRNVYGAAVLLSFPSLEIVAHHVAIKPISFPYESGLLAFREGPVLTEAIRRLPRRPQVIFLNGHGRAHPRRFGMASHLGVILGIPSIGVAARILVGEAVPPDETEGAVSPLIDGGEVIGALVRTRAEARPVVVSEGHMVDLAQAVELAIATCRAGRMPEPIRQADLLAKRARRERGSP